MTCEERDRLLLADDEALLRQCRFSACKSSGRGGQKVNKTSSAVRILHLATGLDAECAEERSQFANRRIALKKLRLRMALTLRADDSPPFSVEPVPSSRNPERRLPWLARVCDALARAGWDVSAAARSFGLHPGKLERILKRDPALWRFACESAAKRADACRARTEIGEEEERAEESGGAERRKAQA